MIILGPVAIAKNGVIGRNNDLPWDLPEDLQHFRDVTRGKTVLMGRKTYESIVKRRGGPLPKRRNLVITSRDIGSAEGLEVFKSMDEALRSVPAEEDVYIIGGAGIFKEGVDKADMMDVTHIFKEYEGDVRFPDIDWSKWEKVSEDPREEFSFAVYKKIR